MDAPGPGDDLALAHDHGDPNIGFDDGNTVFAGTLKNGLILSRLAATK